MHEGRRVKKTLPGGGRGNSAVNQVSQGQRQFFLRVILSASRGAPIPMFSHRGVTTQRGWESLLFLILIVFHVCVFVCVYVCLRACVCVCLCTFPVLVFKPSCHIRFPHSFSALHCVFKVITFFP